MEKESTEIYRYKDSNYVAHFTKSDENIQNDTMREDNAFDKLKSILRDRRINASEIQCEIRRTPVGEAACFTECPWASLLVHAENYSHFGVGFNKDRIFDSSGGPAYYVRPELLKEQSWHENLDVFTKPYDPSYPETDFIHEREWRVPYGFDFKLKDISFLILPNYDRMDELLVEFENLKDEIGTDKFILTDMYHKIVDLWPDPTTVENKIKGKIE